MSDFLIMFLLYSCPSSVGCWSIEWRMRLKGGLILHKQSSRARKVVSLLTNLGKYITKTSYGISKDDVWAVCSVNRKSFLPLGGLAGQKCLVPGSDASILWLALTWVARAPLGCLCSEDKLSSGVLYPGLLLAHDMSLLEKTESFRGAFCMDVTQHQPS